MTIRHQNLLHNNNGCTTPKKENYTPLHPYAATTNINFNNNLLITTRRSRRPTPPPTPGLFPPQPNLS